MAKKRKDNPAKRATRRYSQAIANVGRAWKRMYETEDHGAARDGSVAAQDSEHLAEWCGDKYIDPGGSIVAMIAARMGVADDHLQGTSHLLLPKDTGIFSVWATARSFLEMVGTVYWLCEPVIMGEDRLGRVINERLVSLRGSQRFIEKGVIQEQDIELDPGKRAADVLKRSEAMGYSLTQTRYGMQVDPERPSFTDLVDDLATSGIYSLSAGMSHGEIWAVAHHQQLVEEMDDPSGQDRQMSKFQVTVRDYQALANLLVGSMGQAVNRVTDYLGWDDSNFRVALDRALKDTLKSA